MKQNYRDWIDGMSQDVGCTYRKCSMDLYMGRQGEGEGLNVVVAVLEGMFFLLSRTLILKPCTIKAKLTSVECFLHFREPLIVQLRTQQENRTFP